MSIVLKRTLSQEGPECLPPKRLCSLDPITERCFVLEQLGVNGCNDVGETLACWEEHANARMALVKKVEPQGTMAWHKDQGRIADCLSLIEEIRCALAILWDDRPVFIISTLESETGKKVIQGMAICNISEEEIEVTRLLSAPRNVILKTVANEEGLAERCSGAGVTLMRRMYQLGQELGKTTLQLTSTLWARSFYDRLGMEKGLLGSRVMPIGPLIPLSLSKKYLPVLDQTSHALNLLLAS